MKISASQRKALEAAGYTIGKSGSTVQSKNGGTVGGYNENGKMFSGSKKVRDILAGTTEAPKAAPKAASKAASKAATKSKPVAQDAMKGYRAGDITTTSLDKPKSGGRGNGAAEVKRRKTDTFVNTMKKAIDNAPKKTPVKPTASEKRLAQDTARVSAADRKMREFEDAAARRTKSRTANRTTPNKPKTAVGTNPFTDGKGFNIFGWGDRKR